MFPLNIRHHALAFRMFLDGLAGNPGQIVHLFYIPSLQRGAGPGAGQMMFRPLAFGLLVTANANPDANFFASNNFVSFVLHNTTSGKE